MLVTEFRSWWQNLDLGDISFFLLLEQKVKKEYRLYCIVIEFKYSPLACVKSKSFDANVFAKRLATINEKITETKDQNGLPTYNTFSSLIPFGIDCADAESGLECFRLPRKVALGKYFFRLKIWFLSQSENISPQPFEPVSLSSQNRSNESSFNENLNSQSERSG